MTWWRILVGYEWKEKKADVCVQLGRLHENIKYPCRLMHL
jgi:hypothetical protein